jgi:hypothetical protein
MGIKCLNKDCTTEASFNYPSLKDPLYCVVHKLTGMFGVWNNRCQVCNTTTASYGYVEKTHCAKCKSVDMKDLTSKLCIHDECSISATYGYPNTKSTHCKTHSVDGMIPIKNSRLNCVVCAESGIQKQGSYGFETISHCSKHKLTGMIDIKHKNRNKK